MSRDPTKHPEVRNAIIQQMEREEAEALHDLGKIDAEDIMTSPRGKASTVDVRLQLDRFPEIEELINQYCCGVWNSWAVAEIPRRETIAIYDKFFKLHETLQTSSIDKPLELVFGIGFAL